MSRHRPLIFAGALTGIIVLTVLGVGVRLGAFGLGERQSGAVAAERALVQAAPLISSNTSSIGGPSEDTLADATVGGPHSLNYREHGDEDDEVDDDDDDDHRPNQWSSLTRSSGDRRTGDRDRERD